MLIAVVTLQTFTQVNPIYLGQIHQKSLEVNSSRVLFYLGKKFWEGHTTDIGSQGFHAHLKFLERKFKTARCAGISLIIETFISLISLLFLTLIQHARRRKANTQKTRAPKFLSQREPCPVLSSKPLPMSVYWLATSVFHFSQGFALGQLSRETLQISQSPSPVSRFLVSSRNAPPRCVA